MSFKRSALMLAIGAGGTYLASRVLESQRLRHLKGKRIAITGGTRGLGLALARCGLEQGALVAICARDSTEVSSAVDLLEGEFPDGEVVATTCDVRDAQQSKRFIELAVDRLGGLDVLINNAGVIQVDPLETMDAADFEDSLATHLWAPLHTINAAREALQQSRGRIINIASVGGRISVPHLLPYNVSKFALVGLSEGLTVELAKAGIIVTTVCPGLMRTGSPRNAWFKGRHRDEYAWFSIGDSLPGFTISAEAAARRILAGSLAGKAHLVFPLSVKLAVLGHHLAPGLTVRLLEIVNRLLPSAEGGIRGQKRGSESTSDWSPSMLTYLTDEAARTHNQHSVNA